MGAECTFAPAAETVDGQLLAPIGPDLAAHGVKIKPGGDGKTLAITSTWGPAVSLGAADGSLKVDGQLLDKVTPPRLVDGRWLLPVRAVCEALGFFVRPDDSGEALLIDPKVAVQNVDVDADRIRITIRSAANIEYDCQRLGGPDRLVLDLKHSALATPSTERPVSSRLATTVRWSQFAAGPDAVARVVVELVGGPRYRISRPEPGRIVLEIGEAGQPVAAPPPGAAARAHVIGASIESDGWSAVLLSDRPLSYSLRAFDKPYRLVIDCPNAQLASCQSAVRSPKGIIGRVGFLQDASPQPAVHLVLSLRGLVHFTVQRTTEPAGLVVTFRRARLADQLIVVDAGHGGTDPGAKHRGALEKKLNLDMARRLADLLKGAGVKVMLTRSEDVAVDLHYRPVIANSVQADIFLSIHCNAMPRANTGHGTECYYLRDDSVLLALAVHESVARALPLKDGGVRCRNFCVVRETTMPAALVEVAYLNTDAEYALLTDEQFRQKAAEAMFEGLKSYVEGTPFQEGSDTP